MYVSTQTMLNITNTNIYNKYLQFNHPLINNRLKITDQNNHIE